MIDTDKYEGHRQPWVFTAGVSYPMSKADIALRQDAPLLLEEVKRLREATQQIIGNIELWCNDNTVPKDILMEKLKEMIK